MYAEDAVIEDPVGPSMFDPDGDGHRGHAGIRAFWKLAIEPIDSFRFVIHDSHANGNTCANVGTITTTFPDGGMVDTDLVMVYTVDEAGPGRFHAGVLGAGAGDGDVPEEMSPAGRERQHPAPPKRDGVPSGGRSGCRGIQIVIAPAMPVHAASERQLRLAARAVDHDADRGDLHGRERSLPA